MGTWLDDFSSDPTLDQYWDASPYYIEWVGNTYFDYSSTGSGSSVDCWIVRKRRNHGVTEFEAKFRIAALGIDGIGYIEFGLRKYTETLTINLSRLMVRFYFYHPDLTDNIYRLYAIPDYSWVDISSSFTLNKDYWIKIEKNGGYTRWSYKEDGDPSYTVIATSTSIDPEWEEWENHPDGCQFFAWVDKRSTDYPSSTFQLDQVSITADISDDLDNWPTVMNCIFPVFMTDNYANAPYWEDPTVYNWIEEFDENFNIYEFYDENLWAEYNTGRLVSNHPDPGNDYGALYWTDADFRLSGKSIPIRYVFRVMFGSVLTPDSGDSPIEFWLESTTVGFFIRMNAGYRSDGAWDLYIYGDQGSSNTTIADKDPFNILPNKWYEICLELDYPNKKARAYYRPDDAEWFLIGENDYDLPAEDWWYWDTSRFRVYLDTDSFTAPVIFESIKGISQAGQFDRLGSLVPEFAAPVTKIGSGWGLYIDEPYDELFPPLEKNYLYPLPMAFRHDRHYVPPYLFIGTSVSNELIVNYYGKCRGDFLLYFHFQYIPDPISETYWFSGYQFTVNETVVSFGMLWDPVSGYRRYGIDIGGTRYYYSTINPSYSVFLWFELSITGNTLTADIVYASESNRETIVTDTDFLGSPAEYIIKDIRYYCINDASSITQYILYLMIYGEESLPVDLNSDLIANYQSLSVYAEGYLQPPQVLDPKFFFHKTSMIGGGVDALDGLDPTNLEGTAQTLKEGSVCLVIESTNDVHLMVATIDASAIESPPDVVIPDNNPGDWAWKRANAFNPAFVQKFSSIDDTGYQLIDAKYGSALATAFWNNDNSGYLSDLYYQVHVTDGIKSLNTKDGPLALLVVPEVIKKDGVT